MSRHIKAIIEKTSDGSYSIYTEAEFKHFTPIGYGETIEAAKEDFLICFDEMREEYKEETDVTVTFVKDF